MQQIYEFIANKQTFSRVFMLFLCCLLLSTSTFAQNSSARITIHKKNISVIEALKEVEKQTKLSVGAYVPTHTKRAKVAHKSAHIKPFL